MLGSRRDGTLTVRQIQNRLNFRVSELPDTSYVSDLRALWERGLSQNVDLNYAIAPVEGAVTTLAEPGGVTIDLIHKATLQSIQVVARGVWGVPTAAPTQPLRAVGGAVARRAALMGLL